MDDDQALSGASTRRSFRAGTWFGVLGNEVSVLLPPTEKHRVPALWELIDEDAAFDVVLDALISSGIRGLPGFVLVANSGGNATVVLRGAARAVFVAGGDEVTLEGAPGTTWVERSLTEVSSMTITVGDDGDGEDFVVAGGLVRIGRLDQPPYAPEPSMTDQPAPSMGAAPPPAEAPADSPPPVPVPAVAPPAPDAGESTVAMSSFSFDDEEPAAEPPRGPMTPPPAEHDHPFAAPPGAPGPAGGPPPPPPAPPPAGPVPGLPDFPPPPVAAPPPSAPPTFPPPPATTPPAPADADWAPGSWTPEPPEPPAFGGPVMPPPPSNVETPTEQFPAAGMPPESGGDLQWDPGQYGPPPPAPAADRPVARLTFSHGESIDVDRVVLIGRAPEARRFGPEEQPRLVTVPSPNHEISSTHLEVRPGTGADQGSAVVTDMGSTNGTVLVQPGMPAEDLQAGLAVPLSPGAIIDLGDGLTISVSAL